MVLVHRHQFFHARRTEQARPHPPAVMRSFVRNYRNPHPQRLAGGGGAVIGKGIEGYIHLPIGSQMVLQPRCIARQLEALTGDTVRRERLFHPFAEFPIAQLGAFKVETRTQNRLQNLRPRRHHAGPHLREVIKGAEGHMTVLHERRRRNFRGLLRRPITKKTPLQGKRRLAHKGPSPLRIGHRINHAVVHGRQPRGVGIAQPRHLNRRGPAREHRQPVARCMAVQIYQDIDAVAAYLPRHRLVAHPDNGAPVGNQPLKVLCHPVGARHLGIAGNLHPGRVMGGK